MSECVRLYVCVSVCALPSIVRIEKKVMSANFMIIIGQLAKWQPGWVGATDHCAQADHSAQWFEKGVQPKPALQWQCQELNARMNVHACACLYVCLCVYVRK